MEENFSAILTTFNQLFMAFIVLNIIIYAGRDSFDQDIDHSKNDIFFAVKSTSAFMWGGFSNGIFG